jgi:hypothetical protein
VVEHAPPAAAVVAMPSAEPFAGFHWVADKPAVM